uniref:Lipopolysaccharide-binding protein n=1 Tax=Ditylenchus dipsaci TaxID=166011 RepID=A0A915ELN8_9BILA
MIQHTAELGSRGAVVPHKVLPRKLSDVSWKAYFVCTALGHLLLLFSTIFPTLAARISTTGLEFFSSIGHKIVDHEFPKTEFPPISLPIDGGPGSGSVDVFDLHIPKFQSPHFNFKLAPPNGIFFRSQDGAVKVRGKWKATYDWITTFHISGWLEMIATDIRAELTLGLHGKGVKPQVDVFNCKAEIEQVEVQIAVKQAIHEQFCLTTRTLILDDLNKALMSLPTTVPVARPVFLDYAYTNDTVVSNSYIQASAYIDVVLNNASCHLPVVPLENLSAPESENYMVSFWMSETIFNCLLESVHNTGLLKFVVDKDFDNQKFAPYLSTSCSFYKQHVDLVFHSAKPATASVDEHGVLVNAHFYVDFFISPWQQHSSKILARLAMDSNSTVMPMIFDSKIGGKLNNTEVEFTQVFSTFGDFSDRFLRFFSTILKPLISVGVETTLRHGIPIPLVENIQLGNHTQVTSFDGKIRVDTDLLYVVNSTNKRALNFDARLMNF